MRISRSTLYALYTMYTTSLCFSFMGAFTWAGPLTYISAVLSALSAVMYFGAWLRSFLGVIWGTCWASLGGTLVGIAWKLPTLQFFLIFIGICWINKCSMWSPTSKTFGGILFTIGALWPTVSDGAVVGWASFGGLILFAIVPVFLTGVTLIFPFPMLALGRLSILVNELCQDLSCVVSAYVDAFCFSDRADFHISVAESYINDARNSLRTLKEVSSHISAESWVFPSLRPLATMLIAFTPIISQVIDDLTLLRDMIEDIVPNETHQRFVSLLKGPLDQAVNEVSTVLTEIVTYRISSYDFQVSETGFVGRAYWSWRRVITQLWMTHLQSSSWSIQSPAKHRSVCSPDIVSAAFLRMSVCRSKIMQATQRAREKYVFVRPPSKGPPSVTSCTRSRNFSADHLSVEEDAKYAEYVGFGSAWDVGDEAEEKTKASLEMVPQGEIAFSNTEVMTVLSLDSSTGTRIQRSNSLPLEGEGSIQSADESNKSCNGLDTDMCSRVVTVLYRENLRLGTRNLAPRGAFLCRLLAVMSTLETLEGVLLADSSSQSTSYIGWLLEALWTSIKSALFYLVDCSTEPFAICSSLYAVVVSYITQSRSGVSSELAHLRSYQHPMKLALISSLCSLLVLSPTLYNMFPYGLWGSVVVTLIRQDNAASSFNKGYQRIEGTVVGCLFSYLVSQILQCHKDSCNNATIITVIVFWLGVCAYFRERPRHGYAGIVAGFTPIIVLLGPTRGSQDATWGRVEMTFLGVAVYLIIDNVLLPSRADVALRSTAVRSIRQLRDVLGAIRHSMDALLSYKPELLHCGDRRETHDEENMLDGKVKYSSLIESDEAEALEVSSTHSTTSGELVDIVTNATTTLGPFMTSVTVQRELIELAVLEPIIWHRPFPTAAYERLIVCLEAVALSSRSMCAAITAAAKCLASLPPDTAAINISVLQHMNMHLIEVFNTAEDALKCQGNALKRMFYGKHYLRSESEATTTLSAIITLSKIVELSLTRLDEAFRVYYYRATFNLGEGRVNVGFVTHWQNIYGSTRQHMRSLTQLGIALHRVRSIESHGYCA